MKKQAAKVQDNCPKCSTIPSTKELFTISFAEDWKAPYLAFFIDGTLPTNSKHARKLKGTVRRCLMDSPYLLVYGSDAISPVEITIPTARVSAVNDLEWDTKSCSGWHLLDLEALDEKRAKVERRTTLYHKIVTQA
ncbi:hypothetical protein L3X38_004187 [Prunus dulcis]|uniref:Uncharacterized protein n=1 Tax=Prunus dulcis TaxID=3755 RepID=A0AAD4ZNK3_PRUDU|nr:hypothetical protein L3X38_004187 [Prunus dulcis]